MWRQIRMYVRMYLRTHDAYLVTSKYGTVLRTLRYYGILLSTATMASNSESNSAVLNEDDVALIAGMGFDTNKAKQALYICGNAEAAVNMLLTGTLDEQGHLQAQDTNPSQSQIHGARMIHGPLSQYSIDNGRSACTCIALCGAEQFLQDPINLSEKLNADFLQDMIVRGVQAYNQLQSKGSTEAEHLSGEEVLARGDLFPTLQMEGSIRNGVLTQDPNAIQGLLRLLMDCQSPTGWRSIVMTKSPETVLVCLPPTTGNDISDKDNKYILIDSHPRPQQFNAGESYIRIHDEFSGLLDSLTAIFPMTDLGPDVGELMGVMYNSFDLYPLKRKD